MALDTVYFDRAESVLNPSVIPEDILATEYYQNVRVHHEAMIGGISGHARNTQSRVGARR